MISCKIVSADKSTSYENLIGLTLPAVNGQLEILPGHAEAFMLLNQGLIVLVEKTGVKKIEIQQGGCYVKDDQVIIII